MEAIVRGGRDVIAGLLQWPVWTALAWQDLRMRYRRSVLGPLWITLSLALWVATLGVLFSKLFGQTMSFYIPYLTAGVLTWQFIATMVGDGCQTFVQSGNYIKQATFGTYAMFAYRIVWRGVLSFCHNMVVFIVVATIFLILPTFQLLWLVPGMLLFMVNGLWVAMLLGMLCARFRDVPPIIQTLVQLSFFVTPIMWHPEVMQARASFMGKILMYNPFYHFVQLIRAPLLGEAVTETNLAFALGVTAVGWLITLWIYGRHGHRIPFWL